MRNQAKDCVFLGTPLGATGTLTGGTHWAILNATRSKRNIYPQHNAMSLLTFEEARPWAKSIAKNVAAGDMPPWKANPDHGTFSNDMSLTQSEIDTILGWVEAGAPRGKPTDLPNVPKFTDG